MKNFMSDDFLLQTQTAKTLHHQYAAEMPIFDYHAVCFNNAKDYLAIAL